MRLQPHPPVCVSCGNTGILIDHEYIDDEIVRDRAGRMLLPWEVFGISPERRRAMVAAKELSVQPITIAQPIAYPDRFCKMCDAGREREHQALANTPPAPKKPTRTRKNLEGERDAS